MLPQTVRAERDITHSTAMNIYHFEGVDTLRYRCIKRAFFLRIKSFGGKDFFEGLHLGTRLVAIQDALRLRSEFLRDPGMVDRVVHRRDMKDEVARLCRLLTKAPAFGAAAEPPTESEAAPLAPAA